MRISRAEQEGKWGSADVDVEKKERMKKNGDIWREKKKNGFLRNHGWRLGRRRTKSVEKNSKGL